MIIATPPPKSPLARTLARFADYPDRAAATRLRQARGTSGASRYEVFFLDAIPRSVGSEFLTQPRARHTSGASHDGGRNHMNQEPDRVRQFLKRRGCSPTIVK